MNRPSGSWSSRSALGALALAAAAFLVAAPAPVAEAAAPPPPLDACLAGGSFDIADRECQLRHSPTSGDQFGPIGSVVTHVASRGDTVSLAFDPGDEVFYDRPISCGDVACIYHAIAWRPQDDPLWPSWIERLDGCGGADETCRFRVWPGSDVGDDAEMWLVYYVQHYRGIFPLQGVAHAVYVAPRFYPVRVDSVDASGAPVQPRPASLAYAVRAGRTVNAAACVSGQWWFQHRRTVNPPIPDCVVLAEGEDSFTGSPGWEGDLPADSGDWTIVAAPAGPAAAALIGRPSPYRSVSVRPVGDDLRVQAVQVPRPQLAVTVEPEVPEMALGTTQQVRVTVSAVGGEAGSLTLAFDDPGVVSVEETDTPILVPGAPVDGADMDFSLTPGAERTFLVGVTAVGLGETTLDAIVTGSDDVDRPVTGDASAPIAVVEGTVEPGSDAEAIAPPVVDRAAATEPGDPGPGHLEGTATGTPGGTLSVTIWTSAAASAGACSQRISGPGVQLVGTTELTLGEDGTAVFTFDAPLVAGWFAYGLSSVGPQVSRVGDCAAVAADMPTVSVAAARVTEGTANSGRTVLAVTVSLSQPSDQPVSVRLSTADETADSPEDFAALDGHEVTFPPGQTSASVTIGIAPDAEDEGDETFRVMLSDPEASRLPGGHDILAAEATATIVDDDGAAVTDTPDARGVWRTTYRVRDRGKVLVATYTMTIQTHDLDTGKVTGRIVVESWVPTTRHKVTGSISGDRVDLTISGGGRKPSAMTGTLVRKDGRLTIRPDQPTADGWNPYVLTDPRG